MTKLFKYILFLIFSTTLAGCDGIITNDIINAEICKLDPAKIKINNLILHTEVACSVEERNQGLMYRKILNEDQAMLFVFEKEKHLSFWMKNTSIPLSIAYIDKNFTIIDIQDMHPFEETPVVSRKEAQYALEVNQGVFTKYNIKINDKINFLIK